jgi:hypothetical protein
LRLRVATLTERCPPNAVRRALGRTSIRQEREGIQYHVNPFFVKRASRWTGSKVNPIEHATIGERDSHLDWRKSVRRPAKQTTIDGLMQPEQELAYLRNTCRRAPPFVGDRLQDQHDVCGSRLLKFFHALEQPGGNRRATCHEQQAEGGT